MKKNFTKIDLQSMTRPELERLVLELQSKVSLSAPDRHYRADTKGMPEHAIAGKQSRKTGERLISLMNHSHTQLLDCTYEPMQDTVGELTGIGIAAINLTEQKMAEDELAAAHRQIQSILDNTTSIVYALDLQKRFILANAPLAALLNTTPEQMMGKRRHEFMPKKDADWHEANDRQAIEAGRAQEFEEYSQINGRSITWLTTKFPLRDTHGRIYAVAGISVDISERKHAEIALQRSESRMRRIARAGRIGFVEWSASTDSAYWSLEHYELFGFEPGSAVSWERWLQGVHPADRERVLANASRLLERGRLEGHVCEHKDEYRYIRADKTVVWLESDMAVDIIDGDAVVSGSVRDITERKRAEEDLKKMSRILSEGQKIAHLGSFEFIAATGTTVWSEEEYHIYGLDPAEPSPAYDVMLARYIHPNDRELLHETFTMAILHKSIYELEHRIVRPDGDVRWVHDHAHPYLDECGNLLRYVGATLDITERKRAEDALRQSMEDLDRAQAVGQIGWWRLDTRTNVLTWSAENYRIFGVPEGTPMSYESFMSIVHPDDRQLVDMQWQAALRGESYDIEHRILVDNKTEWVREKAYLEFDTSGQLLGGFGITQYISGRKKTEEQLLFRTEELAAANRELESFSYSVSHDLRNPLNNIKAMCAVLKIVFEKKPDNDGNIAVGYISKSVDRMANTISDLLELSFISRRALRINEINLGEIAGAFIDELKKSQPSRKVEVIIEDTMVVKADHGLMRLALENLIRNAWKYTLKCQNARIEIGVDNKVQQPVYFVRDNGTGFDMKDAQRIFLAFERAHNDEEYLGNGVGLTIVKRIVHKHGGEVWAESEPGKGATFFFTLVQGD